jgi:magnesium-transporting ATPase (P-type)
MASDIEIYTFEDADGNPATDWHTQDYSEAHDHAAAHGYRLIANTYQWADSELIEDFTGSAPDDDDSDDDSDDSDDDEDPEPEAP